MTSARFNVATCTGCGREFHPPVFGRTYNTCEECRGGKPEDLQTQADVAVPSAATPALKLDATSALVAVNVLVFVLMVLGGVSPVNPSAEQLLKWGGDLGQVALDHQWWRLLTSNFVHVGILHLTLNMWALWGLGKLAERVFGSWPMVALYLLSGLGASVTSIWWHPVALGVGASGAIFGVAGGLFAFLKLKKVSVPKDYLRKNGAGLGAFLIYNLLIGAAIARIDNAAHVGGLVTGAVIGALLPLRTPSEDGFLRRYAVLPLALGAIVALAPLLIRARIGFAEYAKADRLVRMARYEEALPLLQDAVHHEPKLQQAQFELGFVCMELNRNSEAEAAYRKALELGPETVGAHFNLALLYREEGRLDEAILELQRAIAIDSKDPKSAYLLGLIYLQKNDSAEAVRWLRNALALKPDYAEAKKALAAAEYPSEGMSR